MAQDPAVAMIVLLFAMFGLPKVLSMLPDIDPLMMIMGIFAFIAFLQHFGIVSNVNPNNGPPGGDASEPPRRSGGVGRPNNFGRESNNGQHGGRHRGDSGRNHRDDAAEAKDLLKEAEQCFQQNSWKRVQEITRKVTDQDPENARAWELLATAQKWDGKRSEAAATVQKARELYEVESEGLKALAKELAASDDPLAVSAENEKRGEDFIAKRQYDLGLECFNKAIDALGDPPCESQSSRSVRLRRNRAECAQQLQDWSLCRRDATVVLEKEPNDTRALLQRAISNEALEKYTAALEDARKLLSLDPKNVAANRVINNCRRAAA